ncbi:MAG: hypothetical protein NTZ07_04560 [Candidatus Woesebacteria bacterium]|nr:hypothetical protein [Candidatus Woesebacteria bacterium]
MRKILSTFILFVVWLFIFPQKLSAQVVINEFSSYESSGDWVELYAIEDATISGWILRDTATSKMATIPQGISIGPSNISRFYVINVGDRLNRDGDVIKLLKQDDSTLVDQISYGTQGEVCAPGHGQSVGRYPDANATIDRFSSPTQGTSNNNVMLDPCPTPTPSPSLAPATPPTLSPTSTPAKTSTPASTPTRTLTPSQVKSPSPTPAGSPEEMVLGEEVILPRPSATEPSPKSTENPKVKFPLSAIGLIALGMGLISFSVVSIIKSAKKSYTIESGNKNNQIS